MAKQGRLAGGRGNYCGNHQYTTTRFFVKVRKRIPRLLRRFHLAARLSLYNLDFVDTDFHDEDVFV